eukprot:SAG11_NODE_289_length_11184_cov_20.648083_7_plen_192_part_00
MAQLDVDHSGQIDLDEFVGQMALVRRQQQQRGVFHAKSSAPPEEPIIVCTSIKLANNSLQTMAGLPAAIAPYLMLNLPSTLQWLDLSFNHLSTLGVEALDGLPNLSLLNLHANRIRNFGAVAALARLKVRPLQLFVPRLPRIPGIMPPPPLQALSTLYALCASISSLANQKALDLTTLRQQHYLHHYALSG